jgi:hypothetical protein
MNDYTVSIPNTLYEKAQFVAQLTSRQVTERGHKVTLDGLKPLDDESI